MLLCMLEIVTPLISGLIAFLGVGLGAVATLRVQRVTTEAARRRFAAESRAGMRAELKTAALNYLEHAQRLQRELDERERGGTFADLKALIEQLWLAEKGVEIICSDALRDRLIDHARGLHQVVRDPVGYPDWWAHCSHLQGQLLSQLKADLSPQHEF
jgi:hypothetical protein